MAQGPCVLLFEAKTRRLLPEDHVPYYCNLLPLQLLQSDCDNQRLQFGKQEIYDPTCDVNKAIFHQYTKWGLPAYLGFDKLIYTSSTPSENYWLINSSNVKTDILTTYSVIKAPNAAPILGQSDIYIEIEKLN